MVIKKICNTHTFLTPTETYAMLLGMKYVLVIMFTVLCFVSPQRKHTYKVFVYAVSKNGKTLSKGNLTLGKY